MPMNQTIPAFEHGVFNLVSAENIPMDAAQDEQNFVTMDGDTVMVAGRQLLGAAGAVGGTTGFHKSTLANGSSLYFCKRGTAIQYWSGSAWTNCITGLVATDEYTFADYTSLAGAFTFINGPGAFYKVVNANPGSPINIYSANENYYGYILIDRGRMLCWNIAKDQTGLYYSRIDPQNSTVYTTVTSEAVGSSGSKTYTGTLGFKSGHTTRNAFGIVLSASTGAGTETFTDNYNGVLTSNAGGTGTINYATGAYSVTFNATTTGSVTVNYLWEDSTALGVADFTFSSTRLAGEGGTFRQDEGGDAILNVLIGQDGSYYSMKTKSAYKLTFDTTDLSAENIVYRKEMGLPYFRAALSTNDGVFFINTVNPSKPEMMILQLSNVTANVEPKILFPQFKFANYLYDASSFGTYDRWILVYCRTPLSLVNDTILMCNLAAGTVDIVSYSGKMSIQDAGKLYVADSVTTSVYSTFDGYDDLGSVINASWTGKDNAITLKGPKRFIIRPDDLKKVRKLQFKGRIDIDQVVQVYINLDEAGFQLVGTIIGSADYVNRGDAQAIGGRFIGSGVIGGAPIGNAYAYYMEMKIKTSKFRKMCVKLVPTGFGYFSFTLMSLWDVMLHENRLPPAYRQKQNVSLDGTETDQD